MSMILHKQATTTSSTQRKWQMLALIILTFLTIIAITYVLLYTVGHVDPLHMLMSWGYTPNILNGRP